MTLAPGASWLVTMSSGCDGVEGGAVDGRDDVAGLEAALRGRAARDDRVTRARSGRAGGRDPGAVRDRQAVGLLDGRVDGLEADPEVRTGQGLAGRRLGHERAGDVDRDREADALGVAGGGGVDADDLSARIEQRAAAVAGVDRGVGLDEVAQDVAGLDRDGAAKRRDDPAGDRVGERRRAGCRWRSPAGRPGSSTSRRWARWAGRWRRP